MKKHILLTLAATLLLPLTANAAEKTACPADFDTFFEAFRASPVAQHDAVQIPLTVTTLRQKPGEDEPKPVTRELQNEQVRYPIFPPDIAFTSGGLVIKSTTHPTPKTTVVSLEKPDSDSGNADYYFTRTDCWRLTKIEMNAL